MKKALIIIDYVNDFVKTDGKLTCGKPAQDIDENIAELVVSFSKKGDFIVIANDNHIEGDPYNKEGNMFPPHCLENSRGCELYGNTAVEVKKINKEQLIEISKSRFSSFCGTPLDLKLRERGVDEVHLVGVCSDICVLHTAIDAYNLGYNIITYSNAIATFNPAGQAFTISHLKNTLGAKII